MSSPAPGWYPDPQAAWQYRYWDGVVWTAHTAPMGAAAPGGGKVIPPLPFPAVRAEFGRRALGYLIDGLVIAVPAIILIVVLVIGIIAAAGSNDNGEANPGIFLVILPVEALVFLLPLAYNTLLTSGGRRTVGQRVIGLRVLDARTGAPLTVGKAFVRSLVAALASGQLWGLGYWWALWDGEQRTWHDMAATSVVIDVRDTVPAAGALGS